METLSLHQLLVIIRQNTPIVAQISAIRVNLEGIGLLSLYKNQRTCNHDDCHKDCTAKASVSGQVCSVIDIICQ